MSVKLRLSYKLSPNEEVGTCAYISHVPYLSCVFLHILQAAVLRSQREERRKARLLQVCREIHYLVTVIYTCVCV